MAAAFTHGDSAGVVPTLVSSIEVSSDLIEDYEQSILPAAGPQVAGRFEAVRRTRGAATRVDLISVHPSGGLLHVFADPASPSGWSTTRVDVPGAPEAQPTELRAFDDGQRLTVLCRYSNQASDKLIAMAYTDALGWQPVLLSNDAQNALGAMTQTDVLASQGGAMLVYGISTAYSPPTLSVVNTRTTPWDVALLQPATPGSTYKLVPGAALGELVLVEFAGARLGFSTGTLANGTLTLAATQWLDGGQGPLVADRAISVPASAAGGLAFVVLTASGALVRLERSAAGSLLHSVLTGQPNQPSAVAQHSVGLMPDGSVLVFAVDQLDSRLWLSTLADAGNWTPLGDLVSAIATPTTLDDAEVFLFTTLGTVAHMARHADSHLWSTSTVRASMPVGDPTPVSSFAYEIRALDANGKLVAGAPLSVTLNRKAVMVAGTTSYHATPHQPVVIRSGPDGTATITVRGEGLNSPALTVTAGGQSFGPYRADLRTHQRLAGLDSTIVVDGPTLQQSGVISQKLDAATADKIASALRTLAGAAVHKATQPASVPLTAMRVEINFSNRARGQRPISRGSAAILAAYPEAGLSIGGFFGDILHFFESLFEDIAQLVIEIVEGAVHLVLSIAGTLIHLVADTIEEIAEGIRLVLSLAWDGIAEIVAGIEAAIKWLRMVFNWEDILATQKVIRYFVVQALSNLKAGVPIARAAVHKLALTLENDVAAAFDGLIHKVAPGTPIGGLVPATSSDPLYQPGSPLQAQGLMAARQQNATRCNYVKRHAETNFNQQAAPFKEQSLDALLKVMAEVLPTDKFEASWQQICDTANNVKTPADFLGLILVVILEAAKDVVLLSIAALDAIVEVLLTLAGDAIDAFLGLATLPLDVPVISWLYKKLTGNTLDALDLMCLMAAAPATILYKIVEGGDPPAPPFPDPQAILAHPIPWPAGWGAPPPALAANAHANVFETPGWDKARAAIIQVLMVIYALEDVALDVSTAAQDPPSKALTWMSAVSVVTEVAVAVFGYPTIPAPGEEPTAVEYWSMVTWGLWWGPPVLDAISTMATQKHAVARTWDIAGPILVSAMGAVLLGVGAKTVYEMQQAPPAEDGSPAFSGWNQAEVLLPSFPLVFQPIVMLGIESPPAVLAQAGLLIIDLLCDVGTGVCRLEGATS